MATLIEKYKEILNPFKKKLSENAKANGGVGNIVKQSALASIPRTQQFQQSQRQFEANPITERVGVGVGRYFQQHPNVGAVATGLNNSIINSIYNRAILNDKNRMVSQAPQTAGQKRIALLSQMAGDFPVGYAIGGFKPVNVVKNQLMSGAFGAGISKAFGGDTYEGASQGIKLAPLGMGTNALISKAALGTAGKFATNPVARQVITRGTAGALGVPEGMAMSAELGRKYGIKDIPVDIVFNALLGTQADQATTALRSNPEATQLKGHIKTLLNKMQQAERNGNVRMSKTYFKEAQKALKEFKRVGGQGSPLGIKQGTGSFSKAADALINEAKNTKETFKKLSTKQVNEIFSGDKDAFIRGTVYDGWTKTEAEKLWNKRIRAVTDATNSNPQSLFDATKQKPIIHPTSNFIVIDENPTNRSLIAYFDAEGDQIERIKEAYYRHNYTNYDVDRQGITTPRGVGIDEEDVISAYNDFRRSYTQAKKVETPNLQTKYYDTLTGGKKIESPKVEQTFKTQKFDVTTKEEQVLKDTLKKLGLDERTVRSFDEMKSIAQDLLGDPKKAVQDIQSGRIKDSEIVALGNVISTSTDRISKLTKELKKNPTDLRLQQALDTEEALLNQAIKKRVKGGTEAGRSVVAFRILANKTLDPTYWVTKAQKQLGESRKLTANEADAINTLIQDGDRLGLAKFVSMLGESSMREKALSLWKAGLLTSFRTHEANILANTAFGGLETLKDIPATGFDIARSKITGTPRAKSFSTMTGTESLKGAKRGVGQAAQYFKQGVDPRDINKFENLRSIRYGNSKGGKLAQRYVDFVFRTLGAEDKVFREAAFNRSIADQVVTLSKNQKISAGEMSKMLQDPDPKMVATAIKDAEYATFNNPNKISEAAKRAKASDGTIATGIDFVFPFIRTPTNVLLRAIDYTPVGVTKTVLQKIMKGGEVVTDRELADAFGRSATGLSLLAAGYLLARDGKIQGASPASEADRSQMYLEGKQPNSILINGKWTQIQKISPVANLLIMGAALYNTEGNLGQKTYKAGLEGVKALSEQSFLKGASSAIGAITDPEKGGKKYIESAVGGIVPNIVKDVARGTDDVLRAKDTVLDSVVAGIPGLNQGLPVKVDALGNPIAQPNLVNALFNPLNPKEATNDPLILEFKRVGYSLNTVGDTISGQKLTPEQQRAYQKLAGAKIREYLVPIIESDAYQSMDTDKQRDLVDRAVTKAKGIARDEIKPQLDSITKGSDRGFKANAAENEPSGKTRGGITLIKRGKDIGNADMGNKGTQIDHKTALALGGNNKRSNQMILTVGENQQKGQVETYLKNEVDKGNITLKEAKKREKNWREEYKNLPSQKAKTETKTSVNYIDDTGTIKTIDVSKYTQPNTETGINKYVFEKDKMNTAYKVYQSTPDEAKATIESMGLNYDDVVYGYHAKQPADVKYQSLMDMAQSGQLTSDNLLMVLKLGRNESISGDKLVTDGMLTDMRDAGLITAGEAKALKNIKYTTKGVKTSTKKSGGKKKAKKAKVVELVKPKLGKRSTTVKKRKRVNKYTQSYIKNALKVNTGSLTVKP